MDRSYLIYDDGCPVCRSFARRLGAPDQPGALTLVPLSAAKLPAGLPLPPSEQLEREVHLISADGSVVSGIDAISALALWSPRWRVVGWLFQLPLVRTVASAVYRLIAGHRIELSRLLLRLRGVFEGARHGWKD